LRVERAGRPARPRTFAGQRAARPGGTGAVRSFRPALTGAAAHGCRAGSRVSGQALLSLCRSSGSSVGGGRAAPPRSGAARVPRAIFAALPAGPPPRGGYVCPARSSPTGGARVLVGAQGRRVRAHRSRSGLCNSEQRAIQRFGLLDDARVLDGGGSESSLSTCRAETGPQRAWRFASRGAGQFPF
jgi:hypothetical protein